MWLTLNTLGSTGPGVILEGIHSFASLRVPCLTVCLFIFVKLTKHDKHSIPCIVAVVECVPHHHLIWTYWYQAYCH